MSDEIKSTLFDACKYNARCKFDLPDLLKKYPINSTDFAKQILELQESLGFDEEDVDGKLGTYTYTQLMRNLTPVDSEYIILNHNRIPLERRVEYDLIAYDEKGGLDLHRFGNFSKRKNKIGGVVLHWGGLNAKHCYNVFSSPNRKVSSHFLIGKEGNRCVVYQVLDLNLRAWHGGKEVNDWTIGIDICQQPSLKWKDHYEKKGYDVEEIENESGRGDSRILSLDPIISEGASLFIKDLMSALNMEVNTPANHDVQSQLKRFTLLGHHHVSSRKWDVACWWSEIIKNR